MKKLVALLGCLFWSTVTLAMPIYTGWFSDAAVSGYDPVAYFTEGRPIEGDETYQWRWQEVDWYFSSPENLAKFKKNPTAYAPQYGGHCAWAMAAKGELVKAQPQYWSIVDNKLYLNYDEEIQQKWLENLETLMQDANQNWRALTNDK